MIQHDQIGRWRLTNQLASGASSIIYDAVHEGTGARAAIKTIRHPRAALFGIIRREIYALSQLDDPRVVRILDQGHHNGVPWYAMERLDGDTLTQRLQHNAVDTDLHRRLTICIGICKALAYLHGRGIVHGDLKPDNVVLRGDEPVLVDFGLAARFREPDEKAAFQEPTQEGTVTYLAPEQILGRGADHRSDLYSLGCLLFQAATGEPPFTGTVREVVEAHLNVPVPDPRALNDRVSDGLADLIAELTAKNVNQRNLTAHAVHDRLSLSMGRLPTADRLGQGPHLHRPLLRGRHCELRALEHWLEDGALAVIRGVSGIGKTFLASELCRNLPRGVSLVSHRCTPDTAEEEFAAFRPVLSRMVDLCLERGEGFTRQIFGKHAPALSLLEPRIRDLPGHEHVAPLQVVNRLGLESRMIRALHDVIGAWTAQRRLLWIVDDAHWLDDASRAFLVQADTAWLKKGQVGLMLLETMDQGRAVSLPDDVDALTIDLPPLPAPDLEQIVADLLGEPEPKSVPRLDSLIASADGNPLYVSEYVRSAVEAEVLGPGADQEAADGRVTRVPVPENVKSIVRARIARLPFGAQHLLDVIAILGSNTTLERLSGIPSIDNESLLQQATRLIDERLLTESASGQLEFVHDQHRNAVIESQTPDALRALNRHVADRLESETPSDPGLLATIARHRQRAGQHDRELAARRRAGRAYRAMGDHRQAADQFRRAVELGGVQASGTGFAEDNVLLAESLAAVGASAGAIESSRHALAALDVRLPQKPQWRRYLLRRLLLKPAARWNPSLRRRSVAESELILLPLKLLSQEYFFADDLDAGLSVNLLSLDIVRANSLDHAPLRTYPTMSTFADLVGLRRASRRLQQHADGFVDRVPSVEASEYWMATSLMQGSRGEWAAAEASADRALKLHSHIWDPRNEELIHVLRGHAQFFQCRFAESEASFTTVMDLGHSRDSDQVQAWAEFSIARSLCACDDHAAALPLLKSALGRYSDQTEIQSLVITLGLLAWAHHSLGERRRALSLVRRCLPKLIGSIQTGYPSVEAFAGVLEVLLDHRALHGHARRLLKKFDLFSRLIPCVRPRYLYYRGRHLRLTGARRARTVLDNGFRLARRMDMAREAALCAGELIKFDDALRNLDLEAAIRHFDDLVSASADTRRPHDAK